MLLMFIKIHYRFISTKLKKVMVKKKKYYYNSFYAMGTRFEAVFPGIEENLGNLIFKEMNSTMLHLTKLMNRHDPESAVFEMNNRKNNYIDVGMELWEIILLCKQYHEKTLGGFDVTISPLMDLWHIKHGSKTDDFIPSEDEINKVLDITGMDKIIPDENRQTIWFENKEVEIDLGGFGKGFALEKAGDILETHGIENAFISFGESSVCALGQHPYGDHWKISIPHPLKPQENLCSFQLKGQAMSTSGSVSNNKYGHIINPLNGYPVLSGKGTSVLSASPCDAEVLSTAIINKDDKEKQKILNTFVNCKAFDIDYQKEEITEIKT